MAPQPEIIKAEIYKALEVLADQEGSDLVMKVKSILLINLDRGRVQKVIEENISDVQDYVWRVANGYKNFHHLVNRLQNDKAHGEWKELLEKMQLWAFNYLVRKGYSAEPSTQDIAKECANEAAIQVINAYFPFDTNFYAWVHVIVNNSCRKYFRNRAKKTVVKDSQLVDLDAINHLLKDPKYLEKEHQEYLRDILNEAISQLSDSRKQVIELTYFGGLSPKDVAEKLGKSIGAIYNLRFYALEDLRKILGSNRNNINE